MPCSGARVDAMHRTITKEYRDGSRKPIDETFVVGGKFSPFLSYAVRGGSPFSTYISLEAVTDDWRPRRKNPGYRSSIFDTSSWRFPVDSVELGRRRKRRWGGREGEPAPDLSCGVAETVEGETGCSSSRVKGYDYEESTIFRRLVVNIERIRG